MGIVKTVLFVDDEDGRHVKRLTEIGKEIVHCVFLRMYA